MAVYRSPARVPQAALPLRRITPSVLLMIVGGLIVLMTVTLTTVERPSGQAHGSAADAPVGAPGAPLSPQPGRGGSDSPAQPAELSIPSIGVRSPLVDLARQSDGALPAPTDYQRAGWYAGGPMPGERGGPPAVIVGHVDSDTGPAVFYRLRDLAVGSEVQVRDIAGSVLTFQVYRIEEYAKNTFPADAVYARSDRAELRLITCTGTFDRRAGSYRDNLVAYAALAGGGS
ncbi:class F sortase [Micromonospora sp. NIE79]|uniref:Class F sortase n=1 Tax=Micromonospora trifolii TaxID=2911208 RepID=A0ABS9N8S8_9ACTN|nr:class F sortase [Micromonospora trifolii]MCG5446080.1 class F sortase [Micromonospora trifolii]